MKLKIGRRPLNPMFYGNEHGLPKTRATVVRIDPEEPTQVGDEEVATIKGAEVAFAYSDDDGEHEVAVRFERKRLIRLAHSLGRIGTQPGASVKADALVGGEVDIYIETARRDNAQRIARFTSVGGPFGG